MTPGDLITVANELLVADGPLSARIRRSISSSYYSVFHAALDVIASQSVGVTGDATTKDAMRRAVTHAQLKAAAKEVIGVPGRANNKIAPRISSYKALSSTLHQSGWSPFMQDVIELQEQREEADYDLMARPRKSEATAAVTRAQRTISFLLEHRTGTQGKAFLALVTAQNRS